MWREKTTCSRNFETAMTLSPNSDGAVDRGVVHGDCHVSTKPAARHASRWGCAGLLSLHTCAGQGRRAQASAKALSCTC